MEFLGVSLSLLFARQIYFSRCPTNRLYLRSGRIATIFTSPIGCRLALWNLVFSNFIVVKSQVLCRPEKKYPLTSIVRNLPSVLELGKDYRSVKGIRLSLKVPDENHAVWKKTRDWENKLLFTEQLNQVGCFSQTSIQSDFFLQPEESPPDGHWNEVRRPDVSVSLVVTFIYILILFF